MSKRLDVLQAVKALLAAALPTITVEGLDGSDAAPDRVEDGGRATIEAGHPGEPEIDLSPLTYNYSHQIPVTIFALAEEATETTPARTAEEVVDASLAAVAAAIAANRFLGGLVDFLDATAPETSDDYVEGAPVARVAPIIITATYATSHPL